MLNNPPPAGWRTGIDKWNATLAPTPTDDETAGYAIGSLWKDQVGNTLWQCLDATTGKAFWLQLTDRQLVGGTLLTWSMVGNTLVPVTRFCGACAYRNATSVSNNTSTLLDLSTATLYDTDNFVQSTNSGYFTIPYAGYYKVWLQSSWAVTAVGKHLMWVRKNATDNVFGSNVYFNGLYAGATGINHEFNFLSIARYAVGDVLKPVVFQNSGGSETIDLLGGIQYIGA